MSGLAFAPIARQAEALAGAEISAPELLELHLERIARLDPQLRAFTRVLHDSARQEARRAQERLDAGEKAPLLGVPIAVKDNVDVAGEITSHGTGAAGEPATEDSEVVRRLRAAGAVVIGKTTLPELAALGHCTDTITWGTTRNPWNMERSPGGSSGGSAAAVAAGLAAGAVGSDGGASVRVPAAACRLFGLKPQRGRISLAPHAHHWYGLTVLGALTRTVLDNALMLDVLSGPAAPDADRPPEPPMPFSEAARTEPRPLRIAVSLKPALPLPLPLAREPKAAVERTAELLRRLGHETTRADPDYPYPGRVSGARYLAGIAEDAGRLAHPERLEGRSRRLARLGRWARRRELRRSLEREAALSARILAFFEDHDMLLTPLVARPLPRADRYHDAGMLRSFFSMGPYIAFTGIWNYTGQPAASVPAGFDDAGMPIAVQLVGRPNDEGTLLGVAAQLEAARPWADPGPPLAS